MTSIAARPAARLTALPMKVEVCVPGGQWRHDVRAVRPRPTAASRRRSPCRRSSGPARRPSARPPRAGPCGRSRSGSRRRRARSRGGRTARAGLRGTRSGGMTMPPLPWTGSTTIAATGPTPDAGSSSAWRTSARACSPASSGRTDRPAVRVRERQEMGVRLTRDAGALDGLAVEADDTARAAEIAAGERDHLAPAGQRAGQPDGRVVGIGAAQAEQDPVQARRGDAPAAPPRRRRAARSTNAEETWLIRPAWSRIAATTSGWEWPTFAAAKLAARSTNSLPSGSTSVAPCASATTSGSSGPPVRGPAPSTARIRSMTRRAAGPGYGVTIRGAGRRFRRHDSSS